MFQYYPGPRLSGLCPVSVLPWPKTQWSLPCFSITLAVDSVVSALFQYYPGPRLSGLCPVSVLPWP